MGAITAIVTAWAEKIMPDQNFTASGEVTPSF
jgi:hypothetical protein